MTCKPDRIPCEVLGCRRTAPKSKYPTGTLIICGKCFRLCSVGRRRAYRDAYRRVRRLEAVAKASPGRDAAADLGVAQYLFDVAWDGVVAEASEARAGIA